MTAPAASSSSPLDERYDRWFLVLLGMSFVFRFCYAGWVQLSGDELMHWQWSRHLATGYPEHPPLIAWMIALETRLFGASERAVRLVSVVAMTGTVALVYRLGREMFGRRAAFFGSLALMMTPIACAGGVIATTDALLSLFWTLTVYFVKKAALDGRRIAWLAAGAAAGLALMAKLPALFLFPATAIVLFGTRAGRSWARRWEPYAAAALAIAIFLPDLIWNSRHGWITLMMRTGYGVPAQFTLRPFGELLAAQLFTVTPVLFVGLMWVLWTSWRRRSDPRVAFLGAYMAVPVLFYFTYSLHASVDIHWPAVGYLTGFVALGAFATELAPPSRFRTLSVVAAVPAVLLVAIVYVVPLDPDLVRFSWSYSKKVDTSNLRDVVDWRQLGEPIGRLLEPAPDGSFILCRKGYALAGLASFYTPGQPPVFLWEHAARNGAAYNEWKDEADLRGRSAVVVDERFQPGFLDTVRGSFDSISAPQRVEMKIHGRVVRELDIAYATGFKGFPDATAGSVGGAAR